MDDLKFFEAISKKFYLESGDPTAIQFYASICAQFNIPFDKFSTDFSSESIAKKTRTEFELNRQWGVRGYPTVIFRKGEARYQVSNGYAEFNQLKGIIDQIIATPTTVDN